MTNQEMLLVEHLGELRKRLIYTLVAFIVFLFGSFIYVQEIYTWLIRDLNHNLAVLGPSEILWVYFMISGVIAIALTIPIAAHQTWLFVKPGLSEKERKTTLSYIPGLFVLFITGLSFGYFVVYPTVLSFLLSLSEGQFETMFTSEKYFKFMINLTLPFGFLFEIPLVVMFLTSLGVINPMTLSKARKISYFLLIVVSILITPPDFISDILVIVPLLVLYECSVTLSKIVYRKKLKKQSDIVIEMKKTS
ncbi:twin-arginine translocase subunit TatC [Peribacillus sp. NJ4]|uniref:twin-arginine translocase subunit TatC n=1 Tax=unclassified Peribacillus TaxID=2675266 RepID=UPI0025A03BA1|nr:MULTISPECIES: twin-arginine translocase subunit TatC [unclassified Peribacillus]MDM5210778.1 twin-arginine translocase subunit TatC [Peribacillus sp. NJ4]MDM5221079.1 twin-arginine translocase subunit TatC [Peribacillus sp. NJ11]